MHLRIFAAVRTKALNGEIDTMGGRVTWFLLGAVSASIVWLAVLATFDRQLLQTFFGFAAH